MQVRMNLRRAKWSILQYQILQYQLLRLLPRNRFDLLYLSHIVFLSRGLFLDSWLVALHFGNLCFLGLGLERIDACGGRGA